MCLPLRHFLDEIKNCLPLGCTDLYELHDASNNNLPVAGRPSLIGRKGIQPW